MPADNLKRQLHLGDWVKVQTTATGPVSRGRVETIWRWPGPLKGAILVRFGTGAAHYLHPEDCTMLLRDNEGDALPLPECWK